MQHNCAGKLTSYKTIISKIFTPLDKANPDTENTSKRELNLAAVKLTTVRVTKLPL
jgi:hypothetical protein